MQTEAERLEDTRKAIEAQNILLKENKLLKKKFNAVKDLPQLSPEPDYVIKTRPPMWDDWRLNIFRGIKENRLKLDANKISRRKCWETGTAYEVCCRDGGMFGQYHCKSVYTEFLNCCYHEREVELDKMRRDTKLHTEWYWLNLYDESGEIGKQKDWKPVEGIFGVWKHMWYDGHRATGEPHSERLKELRKKQGTDVEYFKDELFSNLNLDKEKLISGQIDK